MDFIHTVIQYTVSISEEKISVISTRKNLNTFLNKLQKRHWMFSYQRCIMHFFASRCKQLISNWICKFASVYMYSYVPSRGLCTILCRTALLASFLYVFLDFLSFLFCADSFYWKWQTAILLHSGNSRSFFWQFLLL